MTREEMAEKLDVEAELPSCIEDGEVRLLVLAAVSELRKMVWQPIKTAPKKRNDYLVYQPKHESGRMTLPARICFAHMAGLRQSSHWMPLPAPPANTEGANPLV